MKQFVLISAFLIATGQTAIAACPAGSETLVSCTLKNGTKQLETCLAGDQATYRYGPTGGTPELDLSRHVHAVNMTPWSGVGSAIWEGFTFTNGDIGYEVYYAIDRTPGDNDPRGGITVLKGDKTLATLECDPGSVVTAGYGLPLFEAKEAAGQCWDRDTFSWTFC